MGDKEIGGGFFFDSQGHKVEFVDSSSENAGFAAVTEARLDQQKSVGVEGPLGARARLAPGGGAGSKAAGSQAARSQAAGSQAASSSEFGSF